MRAALALLTVVPVGAGRLRTPGGGTLLAFPLVGGLVGLLWVATAAAGTALWGPLAGAGLVLAADAAVTGGLHLDGVADVGDVLGARRRGEPALAVARDPHVGALGAVALGVVLLLRFGLLAGLLAAGGLWPLLAVPVVGRAAMVQVVLGAPTDARSSVAPLVAAVTRPRAVMAGGVGALALAATTLDPVRSGLAVLVVAGGTRALAAAWRRGVGAASGDLVGACGVLAELLALGAVTA